MNELTDRQIIDWCKTCGTFTCSTTEGHHGCPYGDKSLVDCTDRLLEDTDRVLERLLKLSEAETAGQLVALDMSEESGDGLKRKYIVFKARNGEPIEDCFVLRPSKDPAAREALRAYAQKCPNKELAADILNWLSFLDREAGNDPR